MENASFCQKSATLLDLIRYRKSHLSDYQVDHLHSAAETLRQLEEFRVKLQALPGGPEAQVEECANFLLRVLNL